MHTSLVGQTQVTRGLCSKSCATGNHVLSRPLANREPDVTNGGTRTPGFTYAVAAGAAESEPPKHHSLESLHPTRSTRRPERFKPARVSPLHASRFNMTAANTDTELLTEHFGYPPVVSHPPISNTRPLTVSNPEEKLTSTPTVAPRRDHQQHQRHRRARPRQRRAGTAQCTTTVPRLREAPKHSRKYKIKEEGQAAAAARGCTTGPVTRGDRAAGAR